MDKIIAICFSSTGFEAPKGPGAPCRGFFVGYTFLKAHSIPFKMTLVCTLSVGAFWRGGLLNTLPICHFYSVYEMRHKICMRFFFIVKVVILTPNIILIEGDMIKHTCK